MSTLAFLGAAGTGKTTRLMAALETHLSSSPLSSDRRVLALTRMHGSRHRLIERLRGTSSRDRFDCMTFDRFAWELTTRWRSLLRELGQGLLLEFDYDGTCDAAARVLLVEHVAKWVVARYQITLVDEFQDCRDGRLAMVKAFAANSDLLVAADEFQDLNGTGPSDALAWLRDTASVEELTTFHRTSDSGLLAMAAAFRGAAAVPDGKNAKVFKAPNHNVAAGFLARGIAWSGGDEVVVLSATSSTNPFVTKTLARLLEKAIGTGDKQFGPYKVQWDQSREVLEEQLCAHLGLPVDHEAEVHRPQFKPGLTLPGQRELAQWIESQRSVRGDVSFPCGELRSRARRSVQHLRATPRGTRGVRAMTIHQAKNQEFDRVLVLWPMSVPGDLEIQRRLLYNAVTRAKKSVTIIVQDPKGGRTTAAPFV